LSAFDSFQAGANEENECEKTTETQCILDELWISRSGVAAPGRAS